MTPNGPRPFEGVRVLDLTHVLAGPFCTYQLAVLGADVIKIEAPDRPDMTRAEGVDPAMNAQGMGSLYLAQGGGKRAITLDLQTARGREVMATLITGADVLVQNMAGDKIDQLGFDYAAATSLNPRLIYCSLTGFGRDGPKASDPAYDIVIQAASGLMAANVVHPDGPQRVGPPVVDYGTGAQAAFAIAAALFQRTVTGRGQQIDVSMLDCALMLMGVPVTDHLTNGAPTEPHGNAHCKYAGYRPFETADGLLMVGAFTNAQTADLFDVLGLRDRATAIRALPRTEMATHGAADTALIQECLLEHSAEAWAEILMKAHIPAARVRTLDEALASAEVAARPVLQASGLLPGSGPAALPVAGFSMAYGTPTLDNAPPGLGQDTRDVLSEFGFSSEDIDALEKQGVV